jgi:uncharacterized phage infection (PIP) family protein YhgE
MKLLKRILAVIMMVLSVLVIIVLAAGIVENWIANKTLTNASVRVLSGVDTVLGRTEQALTRLDTGVGDARDRVHAFDEKIATAGENFAENPVIMTALSEQLDLGIGPALEKIREAVQSIRETVLAVQHTIETLNSMPFISIGTSVADEGKLQALSDSVTDLTEGIQEIRDGIRVAKAGAATEVVSALGAGTSRLDAGLENIETTVSGYGDQVSDLRTQVSDLKSAITLWLDVASVVITLALLWSIFAQGVTFVFGLSLFTGENLFARWIGDPAQ